MAQVFDSNGSDKLKGSNGNGPRSMESNSGQKPKDTLAFDNNEMRWDGPVWCSRYGRFENQEDASADDGYIVKGQPPHQGLGLERCEKHGCGCKVPFQHRSYVQDIQRRVEPMVASLMRLEQQVETLVHHITSKEGGASTHDTNGNGIKPAGGGFAERYEETTIIHHAPNNTAHTNGSQHSTEPLRDSFRKLEARIESLMHQMHEIMRHEGHHITEKEPDYYQGGR